MFLNRYKKLGLILGSSVLVVVGSRLAGPRPDWAARPVWAWPTWTWLRGLLYFKQKMKPLEYLRERQIESSEGLTP